jgi:hypothetical protein
MMKNSDDHNHHDQNNNKITSKATTKHATTKHATTTNMKTTVRVAKNSLPNLCSRVSGFGFKEFKTTRQDTSTYLP